MAQAQLKLSGGTNQNRTPTLNSATIQSCNLIRFVPDSEGLSLPQKLGGWQKYYPSALTGIPRALAAWEDSNTLPYLAVGTTMDLDAIQNGSLSSIFPQYYVTDAAPNFTTAVGSATVRVIDVGSNVRSGDFIFLKTQISVANLLLFGQYFVTAIDANTYTINAADILGYPILATSVVSNGGTLPTFTSVNGSSTITVTLANHGFSIGSFFPALVATTFNGVTISGNYVVQPQGFTSSAFTIRAATSANASSTVSMNNGQAEIEYFIGNSSLPAALGFGAGGFGAGGFGAGVSPTNGRTATITNVLPSTPSAGFVTYYFTDILSIPNNTVFSVSGVTPSGYNTVGNPTVVSSTYGNSYSVITVTIGASAVVTWGGASPTAHGFSLGDLISFGTTGALPTGLTAGTNYFVRPINSTTFNLSTTLAGALITTSGSQSGVQTGQLQTSTIVTASATTGAYTSGGTITFTQYAPRSVLDWTLGNWGDILISCPRGGGIFQWEPGTGAISSSIIQNSPIANDGMFIAMPQRQIVAWGSTFNGIQQPLLVRWCDINNFNTWVADVTNQAGSYIIPRGSRIVGAIQAPQQGLLWTDLALWAMQYVNQPYVYQFNEVGTGCGLIGQKAAGSLYGGVFWMGPTQFYQYDGSGVTNMNCPIWDVVFQNMNLNYVDNIRFAANSRFGEVAWYYPSTSSINGENDSYVKYNTLIGAWDYGSLNRSAWMDQSILGAPIGADSSGYIYQHEVSPNADGSPMLSNFRTSFFQLSEAEFKIFVDQIWPDMKWGYFNGSQNASVQITFYVADYPDGPISIFGPFTMDNTVTYLTPRFRGRLVSIGISSNDLNSFWRLGGIRYRLIQDGKF